MKKQKILFLLGLFLSGIFLIPFAFSEHNSFSLNQFFIQEKMIEHNNASYNVFFDYILSKYLVGWNNILYTENQIIFDDPKSVFDYVFSKFPSHSIVYPTETYYYYNFTLQNQTVSGNIRLHDADKGKIHMGYFDIATHEYFHALTLDQTNGMDISIVNDTVKIDYQNKIIWFHINNSWNLPPKDLELLPFEEFIASIYDESSIRFFLLFNNDTNSFYYILNEENGINDELIELRESYFKGKETGYVFFHDIEFKRKILIGVKNENILDNNYYDGPFDQVPPRLFIKEKILAAYPYVMYRGGIDEHGSFLSGESARIAITPYSNYESEDALIDSTLLCITQNSKSKFWSCITYESKKDFHKIIENYYMRYYDLNYPFLKQGWPANHFGSISNSWPSDHTQKSSWMWPKNHDPSESSLNNFVVP